MDWDQQAVFEQVERIELREQQTKQYESYVVIGGILIAGVVAGYYLSRYLCPVSAREGKFYDVNTFITPNEPSIAVVATELQQGSIESNVVAALDYVHNAVTYTSDKKQFGLSEYWTFPVETLENGAGDCEDISFLLSSLLLALNLPSNTVRVSLGSKEGIGHAWVEVLLNDTWFILEGARGTITPKGEANGYSIDCYVYQNKCETLNAGRYGLHELLDPLEALALE